MRYPIPRLLALVAGLLFASLSPVWSEWWLWDSPSGNTEVLDQSQTLSNSYNGIQGGHGVGQTFTPQSSSLYRIDFLSNNRWDERPVTLKLWKWNTDYATTAAQAPLFQDTLSLAGPGVPTLQTVYPRIAVTPGDLYYFEFKGPAAAGEWAMFSQWDMVDRYPGGKLRVNNVFRDLADLYFKTYSTPQGVPTPPTFTSSAPGPWTPPTAPGPPVVAADYFDIIRAYALNQRQYFLNNLNPYCASASLSEAFLYRATGDETYARNAAVMFENAYQWRLANPGEAVLFPWMEEPGFAYLWLRNSPSLTATNHAHIRSLLLDSARKFWPNRELGVMNRSLGGALTYKLVTTLMTDMPEYATWRAYADGLWNEFTTYWDTDEDTYHYNYLSWRYILELAMLYSQDETLWQQPGFQALVRRSGLNSTPLGPAGIYGDTNQFGPGWMTRTWLFDKAAARWNDPYYKWLSYRAFDYQRQYIKNKPLWSAFYNELAALCHAYFDTNPRIPTVPPAAQGEEAAARQDTVGSSDWSVGNGGTGQLFQASASPLVRFDLQLRNGGATTPAVVKLWKWQGSYAATVAAAPLYQDTLDISGPDVYGVRTCYPYLHVTVGAGYYIEVSRGTPCAVAGGPMSTDLYADGYAWQNGVAQSPGDLWFRTYSLTANGSTVTFRREVTPRLVSQRGSPPVYFDWKEGFVPDKLILRSGYGMNDLTAVVNLISGSYGHSHMETGGITTLVDDGALIMGNATYEDRRDQEHSVATGRRYWGGSYTGLDGHSTMEHFSDYRKATVAWVRWKDLAGWDTFRQRRFYFIKDRFLLVRDAHHTQSNTQAAMGNLWHAYDVQAQHGQNWYDIYYREPKGINGWLYKNPERYALLYTVNRPEYEMAERKETYAYGNPPTAPFVISQKWTGAASAGQTKWFDTVLLPHGNELTPAQAAARITVLYDDGTRVALQVLIGAETWTMLDNPGGGLITAGTLQTDASYLITRQAPGTPDYLLADSVTTAQIGTFKRTWPVRTSVELGGYPNAPAP